MRSPVPAIVTGFVLTVFAVTPNAAHAAKAKPAVTAAAPVVMSAAPVVPAASTAPGQIELVRAGDNQMTCPALATEINYLASLDAPAPDLAEAAKPKKKKGGFGFLKALSGAVPLVGGMGGMIGGSLMSAASMAGQGSAQNSADDMMADSRAMMHKAMAGPSIASQRKDRLSAIFERKGC